MDPVGGGADLDAAAGVDEVEAPPFELQRQLLDVGLEEDRVRRALTPHGGRLRGNVDAGDERAELDQLRRRLSGRALQVEHVLALDFR